MRKRFDVVMIGHGFVVAQAWAVDTYNPANGQLTIPLVTVGTIDYSNVVINVGKNKFLQQFFFFLLLKSVSNSC